MLWLFETEPALAESLITSAQYLAGENTWYGDSDRDERFSLYETFAALFAAPRRGGIETRPEAGWVSAHRRGIR